MESVNVMGHGALFGGLSGRGAAGTGDGAWLQAMLGAGAALARALERAGLAPAGAGAAVTSQHIIDTAVMLMARQVLDAVEGDLSAAAADAAGLAGAHRGTIMTGRTLLQQAVPVTFGLIAVGWLAGIDGARQGLGRVRHHRLAVQLGGAAGTLAALGDDGPRVRALLAEELGLALPVLPWHTERLRVTEPGAWHADGSPSPAC
jgi:3-carboxy-cis,cis-muconate cycloisomerase